MTGEQMLAEIARRDYYEQKEKEHIELVECAWYAIKVGVIIVCLLSIVKHVRELWIALASCFS